MIMQTPPPTVTCDKTISDVIYKGMKDLELSLEAKVNKQNELIKKNHDKVMSKTEVGHKKIEEVTKRLEKIERGKISSNPAVVMRPPQERVAVTSTSQNNPFHWNAFTPCNGVPRLQRHPTTTVNSVENQCLFSHNTNGIPHQHAVQPDTNRSPPTEKTWSDVAAGIFAPNTNTNPSIFDQGGQASRRQQLPNINTNPSMSDQGGQASWRQKLHILHGTAEHNSFGGSFSADIDIVAYNVAKHITSAELCSWLARNGLFVKDCKLLTTAEGARSLTYKITIDPKDYDRATNDVSLWPYRVGVRLFKTFIRKSNIRDGDERRTRLEGGRTDRNGDNYRYTHV